MHITLSTEEVSARIAQKLRSEADVPDVVLIAPSLDEVRAAIDAGIDSKVTLTWLKWSTVKDVTVKKGEVFMNTKLSFKEVTLTQLYGLKVNDYGGFTFSGVDLTVEPEYIGSLGRARSYSHSHFKVSIDVTGGGEFEGTTTGHGTALGDDQIDVRQ